MSGSDCTGIRAAFCGLAAFWLLLPLPAIAQSLSGALEWLPTGSLSINALTTRPAERMTGGDRQSFFVEFGRLAFRSPDILGGNARRAGLSCQACHSNGHINTHFFIPGLSDQPGRVDTSHAFWLARGENHVFDPLRIPSLRGVIRKHRLGHDGRISSLREFTRDVMVLEFAGEEPDMLLLDALVAYQRTLQPTQAPDEPVTLAGDLADLERHMKLMTLPLAEEDTPLTARIASMLRGQIGFIGERFERTEPRRVLENWSRELQTIAARAEAGAWPEARQRHAALARQLAAPPSMLADAAADSLYDPERLRAWLENPARTNTRVQ